MRLLVPSATIAILAGACRPSLASAADGNAKEQRANGNNDNFTDAAKSQVVHNVDAAYEHLLTWSPGKECNTFEFKRNSGKEMLSDIGILGCSKDQTCVPDDTSSVGGRCAAAASSLSEQMQQQRPRMPVFKKRRNRQLIVQSHRQLDDHQLNDRQLNDRQIGTGDRPNIDADGDADEDEPFECPANCPQSFCDCARDDGDAEVCAPELHDVCTGGLIADCVPNKYLPFYEETYCPFARCLVLWNRPYEICSCDYYGAYCDLYYNFEESTEKCAISACCEGKSAATKYACLPELEPTGSPTPAPTDGPTTEFPSTSPSASPSGSPTAAPSSSSGPTASPSFRPSLSPSISERPTPLFFPSADPTGSAAPTSPPSVLPTSTMAPTPNPTTLAPTDNPTAQPTKFPTESPTKFPTESPTGSQKPVSTTSLVVATSDATRDGAPGEEEEETQVSAIVGQEKIATQSSGTVGAEFGMTVASLVAGFGWALWLSLV